MQQRRATDRPAFRAYPAQRAAVSPGLRRGEVCITFAGRLFSPAVLLDRTEAEDLAHSLQTWCDATAPTRDTRPLLPA